MFGNFPCRPKCFKLPSKTAEHLILFKANLKKPQMGLPVPGESDDEELIENETIEQLEVKMINFLRLYCKKNV